MENEINFEAAAKLLGVPRSVLPDSLEPVSVTTSTATEPITIRPLDDHEWAAVAAALPKLPVPKPDDDFCDRAFIEACRWVHAAKQRGVGWGRLPAALGPESSRRHRWMRWAHLRHWTLLAERLRETPPAAGLQSEFDGIAAEAERYRLRILEQRERLTGQP